MHLASPHLLQITSLWSPLASAFLKIFLGPQKRQLLHEAPPEPQEGVWFSFLKMMCSAEHRRPTTIISPLILLVSILFLLLYKNQLWSPQVWMHSSLLNL